MARLKKLRDIINELKAANFDLAQLPVNNDLRKYDEWLSDPTKRERTGVPDSGKKSKIGIQAFGFPDTDDKVVVKIGSRAKTEAAALSTDKALLGHTDTLTGYSPIPGFSPAKVVLAKKIATVSVPASKITGNKYKKSTGASYTMPFGKNGANTTEFKAQEAILASESISAAYSITFTPEKVRRV